MRESGWEGCRGPITGRLLDGTLRTEVLAMGRLGGALRSYRRSAA